MKKEKPQEEAEWDKKRVAIGLLVLGVLLIVGLEGKRMFLDNSNFLGESAKKVKKQEVKPPEINLSSQLAPKVEQIRSSVEGLNVEEIATSSPQIQKVLNDIKGIKDLPANQAKEACLKLCSSL